MKKIKLILIFLTCLYGYSQEKLCLGDDAKAVITAPLLADGTYKIKYNLTGANSNSNGIAQVVFVNGIGNLLIPGSQFSQVGITLLSVFGMSNIDTDCYSNFPTTLTKNFEIREFINLGIQNDYTFCVDKNKRLSDISNKTQWFDYSKQPIGSNELLETGIYYYKNVTNNGCLSQDFSSTNVDIQECALMVPNAFSPNGDNWNDTFNAVNIIEKYPKYEMTIVNRYGMIVYKGKNGWNGTMNNKGGEVLENGVYFLYLDFKDENKTNTKSTILLQK